MSVVHSHAEGVLAFCDPQKTAVPVCHSLRLGNRPHHPSVGTLPKKFGDTNLLVTNAAQGR